MPQVQRTWIDGHMAALNEISETGRRELASRLRNLSRGRSIPDVRDEAIAVMDAICGATSQMAAAETSIFYDGLRERIVGEQMGAYAHDPRVPEATERAVRAFVQRLLEDDYDGFEALCLERVDYETRRAAGRCVQYNVQRDPFDGEVRYARVPTGAETCDFCVMLASRGPVYHSAETAGLFDHYHSHCDCAVIPFWGTYEIGPSRRASLMDIEGYDPDALYEQYCQSMLNPSFARRVSGGGGGSTSHPMTWAAAARGGVVTLRSVGEVQTYIRESRDYEDLFERIRLISSELPYYGLSDRYVQLLNTELREQRRRLMR